MSKTYTVTVPDEIAINLESNDDVEIHEVHDSSPAEKQAELQDRMGLDPADSDSDDSKGEAELADLQREQLRDFVHRDRKDGIDK